jgi:hypothetical protein
MGQKPLSAQFVFVVILVVPAFWGEAAQKNKTFVINGHPGEVAVIERDGHAYVEIEALARMTNGSLSFNGNQIILTMPAGAPVTAQASSSGFTKDFIRAGIEEMAAIREWRSTLRNAVQRGYPVTEDWIDGYRARAEQSLRLVSLAATTDSDKNAFQLLSNEFNNMKKLSDRFLEAEKSRTYISHESLNNDPLDQKILNCARSLAAMAASGQFSDDGSCH